MRSPSPSGGDAIPPDRTALDIADHHNRYDWFPAIDKGRQIRAIEAARHQLPIVQHGESPKLQCLFDGAGQAPISPRNGQNDRSDGTANGSVALGPRPPHDSFNIVIGQKVLIKFETVFLFHIPLSLQITFQMPGHSGENAAERWHVDESFVVIPFSIRHSS